MNNLKFSIIIASYNSEKNILKAINSIKNQNYDNYEIIFVDGMSTDKTLDIINANKPKNHQIISEKDSGIADAWNKGLDLCNGEIVGILNSDDYYDKNIFQPISNFFRSHKDPFIGYGDITWVDSDYRPVKKIKGRMPNKLGLLRFFGFMHPSVFFSKRVIELNGKFSQNKRVALDTDWMLRARHKKIPFQKIPSHTFMKEGGLSNDHRYAGMGEYMDSLLQNGYKDIHIILFLAIRLISHSIKFIFKAYFKILKKTRT